MAVRGDLPHEHGGAVDPEPEATAFVSARECRRQSSLREWGGEIGSGLTEAGCDLLAHLGGETVRDE
jgi:hypothetical protein